MAFLKGLFRSPAHFDPSEPEYRQTLLINWFLIIAIVALTIFGLVNFSIGFLLLGVADAIGVAAAFGILIYLRKTGKVRASSILVLALLTVLIDLFFLDVGHQFYSFYIMSVAFPIAFFLLGTRGGMIYSLVFITYHLLIIGATYEDWPPAIFGTNSMVNLSVGSLALIALLYFYEQSRVEAFGQLELRNRELERLTLTDELTGLNNRRSFNSILERELSIARRFERWFCFALLDVDNFKTYNDLYGHQQGDNALRKVGEVLLNSLDRGADYAFRVGGEEFAIVFIADSSTDALALVDRIRRTIFDLNLPHEKNGSHGVVTISAGFVALKPSQQQAVKDIYRKADEMLYEAKGAGRNLVVSQIEKPSRQSSVPNDV